MTKRKMTECQSYSKVKKILVLLSIGVTLLVKIGRPVEAFVPFLSTNVPKHRSQHAISHLYHMVFKRGKKNAQPLHMASSSVTTSSQNVVYQKIVRPPTNVPPALFLGNLVEFLQDRFQLPDKLPMVYEPQPDTNDVVSWDSPLSSCSTETRMNVEVVGIYTDDDTSVVPNMAMVVVNKAPKPPKSRLAPMMQNLFTDSEKRILRALDRGLDDVQQGKIQFSRNSATIAENLRSVEEAIDAEIVQEMPTSQSPIGGTLPNHVVNDTTIKFEDSSKSSFHNANPVPAPNGGEDYAVLAAKKVAAARRSMSAENKDAVPKTATAEYAVEAAKRAAASRNGKETRTVAKMESTASSKTSDDEIKMRSAGPRRFTISTPKQRAERKMIASNKNAATKDGACNPVNEGSRFDKKNKVSRNGRSEDIVKREEMESLNDADTEGKDYTSVPGVAKSTVGPLTNEKMKDNREVKIATNRSINLRVHETNDTETAEAELTQPFETMLEQTADTNVATVKRTVTQSEMELEVMAAAQKVMSEMEAQELEMSPEELLRDVMTFGDEKDKENAIGSGFVTGAFEKAKELLQEQKQRRDQRLSEATGFKDMSESESRVWPDFLDPEDRKYGKRVLTAEEELKRIFEAGERLADGRIEIAGKTGSSGSAMTENDVKDQEEVDALIAGDKTVSGYARSLDDELTELEVRINKSPGEEMDGPVKNPRFDIFSGPEVYNPNVDAETAVNWPGAQYGTKDLRLPKELDEAVKQAKFAADVLSTMREMEGDNGKQFFLGDRELTPQQVESLRTVLNEGVEIGLVRDPLELLEERSRMQMVVDELWNQPEERFREISSNFLDLLLSDNFVVLITERLEAMADRDLDARRRDDDSLEESHARERLILGHLVESAQLLLKEARALGAELEASQLEIIRSICQVAMDPSHRTEEETATALTDAVRDMRPLLDNMFVAYLKYAIAEEEGRLARAGLLDDPEHNEWLFVLKIVQQGVYTEISRGINRYIEHIWYVLRMETKSERRMLLSTIIDKLPTMDVRPFVQVVDNIVASLGDSARGEFDGYKEIGEMSNKLLQLRRDVKELLPAERIQSMSRDADEWAAKQKQRLLEQRKVTQQRLQASRDNTDYDDEIRRRGEMERIS